MPPASAAGPCGARHPPRPAIAGATSRDRPSTLERVPDEHLRLRFDGGTVLFTTRRGGVSQGPYASLNLGSWTDDDPASVEANRERVRVLAGAARLQQGRQVH